MSLIALAAAAALTLVDPTGDAAGDGSLMPPTTPTYANAAVFDLQELRLAPFEDGAPGGELVVAMGAIEPSERTPAGFSHVVVDVYLDTVEGGAEATLDGPAMLMPVGRGWDHVVRISPRGAASASAPAGEEPLRWEALELSVADDLFMVTLPFEVAGAELYAVTGLFDAFSPTEWRAIARTATPWAFSSETQVVPVLDVLAADQAGQVKAVTDGVLPMPARPASQGAGWLVLAVGGVVVALGGLYLRRLVPGPVRDDVEPVQPEDEPEAAAVDADQHSSPEQMPEESSVSSTVEGPALDGLEDRDLLDLERFERSPVGFGPGWDDDDPDEDSERTTFELVGAPESDERRDPEDAS